MIEQIAKRMEGISPFYVMALLQQARELERQGRDIVHMEIGEPDFATPEHVIQSSIAHLQSGQIKYTPAAGLPELREKIASFYQQRYAVAVDKNRIFITPGASGAFLLALAVTLNPGEEVLLADPCYPCNKNFVRLFDAKTRLIPVDASTDYQLNAQLIQQYWGDQTKAVLITSPSNPTGTVIKANVLRQSIEAVNSLGGCFFADEIYHGLVYAEQTSTALDFSDQVFVINSFSKFFGMTGWRVGWMIVPEVFCQAVEKLAQNIFISAPAHSQFAALAAFDEKNLLELERRRREFAKRRDFLYGHLQRLGFDIAMKPQGAFYIYADCSRFTDDSCQFASDLLQVEGVAVTPGKDFGDNHPEKFIRFAYTTSIERLQEGITRIERFLKQA
jgi:aspartate/methionine/tyrosine aminotransferase